MPDRNANAGDRHAVKNVSDDASHTATGSFGPDPFSGLSETDLSQIEKNALGLETAALKRKGVAVESSGVKRLKLAVPANKATEFGLLGDASRRIVEVVDQALQQVTSTTFSDRLASDEAELSPLEIQIPRGFDGGRQVRSAHASKSVRHRHWASELDAAKWPPANDLGIYSHNFTISRSFYQSILRRVGLSGELAYNIDSSQFDRQSSPDHLPFMASTNDGERTIDNYSILQPSPMYVCARWVGDKPLYYPVSLDHLTKLSEAERKFLEAGKNALTNAEMEDVSNQRAQRITTKYAIIEFTIEKNNRDEHFRSSRPNTFYNRPFALLSGTEREELFSNYARRYPEKEMMRLRDDESPAALTRNLLNAMNLPESYASNTKNGTPLFLNVLTSEIEFKRGKALRAQPTNYCVLLESRDFISYHRLNDDQARKISKTERNYLGLVPPWTRSLGVAERYDLGLLPPASTAFKDEVKIMRDLGSSRLDADQKAVRNGHREKLGSLSDGQEFPPVGSDEKASPLIRELRVRTRSASLHR